SNIQKPTADKTCNIKTIMGVKITIFTCKERPLYTIWNLRNIYRITIIFIKQSIKSGSFAIIIDSFSIINLTSHRKIRENFVSSRQIVIRFLKISQGPYATSYTRDNNNKQ